jgi:hypothetical protein
MFKLIGFALTVSHKQYEVLIEWGSVDRAPV